MRRPALLPLCLSLAVLAPAAFAEGSGEDSTPAASPPQAQTQAAPAAPPWKSLPTQQSHYLLADSALPLAAGSGYVTQSELILTTARIGVTDFLSVHVDSVLPLMAIGSPNVAAGARATFGEKDSLWHYALALDAGHLSLMLFDERAGFTGVLPTAAVTYGRPDAQLTFSVGLPLLVYVDGVEAIPPVLALSGSVRLTQSLSLVSESSVILPSGIGNKEVRGTTVFNALAAARFNTGRWNFDVGATVGGLPYLAGLPALPWVGVGWSFGPGARG